MQAACQVGQEPMHSKPAWLTTSTPLMRPRTQLACCQVQAKGRAGSAPTRLTARTPGMHRRWMQQSHNPTATPSAPPQSTKRWKSAPAEMHQSHCHQPSQNNHAVECDQSPPEPATTPLGMVSTPNSLRTSMVMSQPSWSEDCETMRKPPPSEQSPNQVATPPPLQHPANQ